MTRGRMTFTMTIFTMTLLLTTSLIMTIVITLNIDHTTYNDVTLSNATVHICFYLLL
jgi:hypothetical protein